MKKISIIQFESTTRCNSRCTFCPRDFTRPKGEMSNEMFHKIIRQGKELGAYKFLPFLNGEPFMFPRIFEWLAYLDDQNVTVHLYTNASLLTPDKVDLLVQFKCVRYIYCSFSGATPQTYEKVMRGLDFEKTKSNIYYLISQANCTVRVGMVVMEQTAHEQDMFVKLWGRRRAKFSRFKNWSGARHDILEDTNDRFPCRQVRTHLTVLWDGRVCLCCFDYDGQVIFGDLNKQSMKEIWLSAKPIRDRHYNLDFDMPLCRDCNFNVVGKVK